MDFNPELAFIGASCLAYCVPLKNMRTAGFPKIHVIPFVMIKRWKATANALIIQTNDQHKDGEQVGNCLFNLFLRSSSMALRSFSLSTRNL